jgi:prophage antirepressor-like protein
MDEEPREIIKSFNNKQKVVSLTYTLGGKQNTTDNTIINENNYKKSLLVKQFNGLNIQVYGTYEEPLFKAKDVGDLLEMSNIREIIKSFNNKQRCDVSLTDAIGREQNTTDNTIINEDNYKKSLLVKQFNGLNIQVYGTYEEPLFKAKDVGDLLGIDQIRKTIQNLDEEDKVIKPGNTVTGLQEQWFLTENGLYEVLFISRKPIAKQFKKWVKDIIKEIRLRGKYDLEEKLKEQQQLLQAKELEHQQTQQELVKYKEKTYEAIEKTGHVYVIKTDAQGAYKVGKTKDVVSKRIRGLQTGNVDDIQVLLDFETNNADLLERCAHYVLDRYRCNSNREFFDCNVSYIKTVVAICGNVLDTLKSTYQHISEEELLSKLAMGGVNVNLQEVNKNNEETSNPPPPYNCMNADFYNWLDKNVVKSHNSLLRLKDVCESYTGKPNVHSKVANGMKTDLELWIKSNFQNIRYIYTDSSFNGMRYKGWIGLELINV